MFAAWKIEKARAALVAEAQAVADRLAGAKPHQIDSLAAEVHLCALRHAGEGQSLHGLAGWTAAERARFVRSAQGRIAALRKARDYAPSDGLAVWLHTARALDAPDIRPPVEQIWLALAGAGRNADAMIAEAAPDAVLPRRIPDGFAQGGDSAD